MNIPINSQYSYSGIGVQLKLQIKNKWSNEIFDTNKNY